MPATAPTPNHPGAALIAYILSSNIHRRHITKGQRAMTVARIYPEPEKGGRGKTVRFPDGISKQRISEARVMLRFAPDVADNVLTGTTSLDVAYQIARQRKDAAATEEARLARLRDSNPDLACAIVARDGGGRGAAVRMRGRAG